MLEIRSILHCLRHQDQIVINDIFGFALAYFDQRNSRIHFAFNELSIRIQILTRFIWT